MLDLSLPMMNEWNVVKKIRISMLKMIIVSSENNLRISSQVRFVIRIISVAMCILFAKSLFQYQFKTIGSTTL